MDNSLYEALKVIGETCIKAEGCTKCPLYYVNPNPLRDDRCVLATHNPGDTFEHIVPVFTFDFGGK